MAEPESGSPQGCRFELEGRGVCPLPADAQDGEGYCICHSRNPKKDRNTFERITSGRLEASGDCTGFVFPIDCDFRKRVFKAHSFRNAVFMGATNFHGARFPSGADFCGATFVGNANFGNSEFGAPNKGGDALFCWANFQGEADFSHATFHGNARFDSGVVAADGTGEPVITQRTKFVGPARFVQAVFYGAAAFREAVLGNRASFARMACIGRADFRRAKFGGEATFIGATFHEPAAFVGDKQEPVFSVGHETDFREVTLLRPHQTEFRHAYLGRARFAGTDVRQVDFTGVIWADRKGRNAVWDEVGPDLEGEKKDYALIHKLYLRLKQNYEEQRDPITAGDFHYGEIHMRPMLPRPTRAGVMGWLERNRVWRWLGRKVSFLTLYRWFSGYGESYGRALSWLVGMWALFALLFWVRRFGLQLDNIPAGGEPVQAVRSFWDCLLYSLTCLLPGVPEPFRPACAQARWASVAESIFGPVLIAMFTLALNRRFKR